MLVLVLAVEDGVDEWDEGRHGCGPRSIVLS